MAVESFINFEELFVRHDYHLRQEESRCTVMNSVESKILIIFCYESIYLHLTFKQHVGQRRDGSITCFHIKYVNNNPKPTH